MSDQSSIEWTDATWNPTTGCTKVSPGCAHCYIERTPAFRIAGRTFVNGATDLRLHADRLEQPLHWKKPRRVFVNSLSDLFHEDVSDMFIMTVFSIMEKCPQHTFQVLTKRADRMQRIVAWLGRKWADEIDATPWPLPNVWLGVSVENQHFADERIPLLLQTPAAVRFISAEPLLGPVNLFRYVTHIPAGGTEPAWDRNQLDWVIVGGESGPKARPFDVAWARSIVQQCQAAGVACFVKQLGAQAFGDVQLVPHTTLYTNRFTLRDKKGGDPEEWPADLRVREFPEVRMTK